MPWDPAVLQRRPSSLLNPRSPPPPPVPTLVLPPSPTLQDWLSADSGVAAVLPAFALSDGLGAPEGLLRPGPTHSTRTLGGLRADGICLSSCFIVFVFPPGIRDAGEQRDHLGVEHEFGGRGRPGRGVRMVLRRPSMIMTRSRLLSRIRRILPSLSHDEAEAVDPPRPPTTGAAVRHGQHVSRPPQPQNKQTVTRTADDAWTRYRQARAHPLYHGPAPAHHSFNYTTYPARAFAHAIYCYLSPPPRRPLAREDEGCMHGLTQFRRARWRHDLVPRAANDTVFVGGHATSPMCAGGAIAVPTRVVLRLTPIDAAAATPRQEHLTSRGTLRSPLRRHRRVRSTSTWSASRTSLTLCGMPRTGADADAQPHDLRALESAFSGLGFRPAQDAAPGFVSDDESDEDEEDGGRVNSDADAALAVALVATVLTPRHSAHVPKPKLKATYALQSPRSPRRNPRAPPRSIVEARGGTRHGQPNPPQTHADAARHLVQIRAHPCRRGRACQRERCDPPAESAGMPQWFHHLLLLSRRLANSGGMVQHQRLRAPHDRANMTCHVGRGPPPSAHWAWTRGGTP
ncbi:hypothetical protein GGX14DRAFT_669749 [Mycena pura]|uniref:Uncharacterized protein n=1 Tax=Mycena pura TaxID=153505 RepID=A0AAD6VTC1_9AGAR|nr:hypothetical protein GGX14DRAFT_669749 [Mycena pura]